MSKKKFNNAKSRNIARNEFENELEYKNFKFAISHRLNVSLMFEKNLLVQIEGEYKGDLRAGRELELQGEEKKHLAYFYPCYGPSK